MENEVIGWLLSLLGLQDRDELPAWERNAETVEYIATLMRKCKDNERDINEAIVQLEREQEEMKRGIDDMNGIVPGATDPHASRPVILTGPEDAVQNAKRLLMEIVEGNISSIRPSTGSQDPNKVTITITVPDHLVGFLIGKRGEGMKHITNQTKARVSVDPPFSTGAPTRLVYVSGAPESVALAQQMIHDRLTSSSSVDAAPATVAVQPQAQTQAQSQATYAPPAVSNVYNQDQLKQIYEYYLQYYLQAGCDMPTATEAAKSAMAGAGIPPYVEQQAENK